MAMIIQTGAGPVTVAIDIYTNGAISIDGQDTGLGVTQRGSGTVLYRREISELSARSLGCEPVRYEEIPLPHQRYSLNHAAPLSGNPGLTQFEADVRAILAVRREDDR